MVLIDSSVWIDFFRAKTTNIDDTVKKDLALFYNS